MFTGIVEEIGTVRAIRTGKSGALLEIEASKVLEGTAVGDSIAVNGVALRRMPCRRPCAGLLWAVCLSAQRST